MFNVIKKAGKPKKQKQETIRLPYVKFTCREFIYSRSVGFMIYFLVKPIFAAIIERTLQMFSLGNIFLLHSLAFTT